MGQTQLGARIAVKRKRGLMTRLYKNSFLYLMAIPGILFLVVFQYVPMFGLIIAFKDFNISKGIFGSEWVGFENFSFFLFNGDLGRVMYNTVFLNCLFIIFSTFFSVFIALMLNDLRSKYMKRMAQSVIFLPYFMSWIVVSMIISAFIGGNQPIANDWMNQLGLPDISWYMESKLWPLILTLAKVWQSVGYMSIIYLAVITNIPEELYEAARMDGASKPQRMLRITLPLLLPMIMLLTLLSVGRIFYGDFAMIYAIVGDNGLLYSTTDVIDTYVYRALRQLGDLGMASAVGLIQSCLGFVLVLAVNWIVNKYSEDSALF